MDKYIIELLTAFLGAFGFALLWNVKKQRIFVAAVGGLLAWGAYIIVQMSGNGIFSSAFFAALITAIYCEISARIFKCPATVFLMPALVPLFPGSSLYYTLNAAVHGNFEEFSHHAMTTLYFALGLACGASILSALLTIILPVFNKINKNTKNT